MSSYSDFFVQIFVSFCMVWLRSWAVQTWFRALGARTRLALSTFLDSSLLQWNDRNSESFFFNSISAPWIVFKVWCTHSVFYLRLHWCCDGGISIKLTFINGTSLHITCSLSCAIFYSICANVLCNHQLIGGEGGYVDFSVLIWCLGKSRGVVVGGRQSCEWLWMGMDSRGERDERVKAAGRAV